MLEFFAGRANLSRCMRASGYTTVSLDILYDEGAKESHNTNFMDINSPSGLACFVFSCRYDTWAHAGSLPAKQKES